MTFNTIFETYIKQYTEHKEVEIKLDVIKQGIKKEYEKQEERILKTNGVIARTKTKVEYELKEEIYEFLEDYGYLPLVVKVNKSIEKVFNIEKARTNHRQSIRLYTGGKSIVDQAAIADRYNRYLEYSLEDLTEEFKRASSEEKLAKAKLEETKEQLKNAMPSPSISTDFGTLKITDSYDYDMNTVFDGISGKKEIFIKKIDHKFEVVVFPEEKSFVIENGDELLGTKTIEELYITSSIDKDQECTFVKKRLFNTYLKEGFSFNKLQMEVDPFEFFRKCEVSKTKINDLIQQGIIDEKDIKPFVVMGEESSYVEVMSEGSAEEQASVFQKKFMEKAQNYRMRKDDSFAESAASSSHMSTIDIDDFSF